MFRRWWYRFLSLIVLGAVLVVLLNSAWFLKLFYPYPHRDLIMERSQEYKVDPYLVLALIRTESHFRTRADSRVGARGLMQIMPETGLWIAGQMKIPDFSVEKLYQPDYNITMGIWYLAYLDKVFQGDLVKTLAAYNAGEHKVKKWLHDGMWSGRLLDLAEIPYDETREYINKVLFDYQVYKRIYQADD